YITFDKDKDNIIDNSKDRPGNNTEPTTAELLAAWWLLQLMNPEGRTPIKALNREADSAEWITKQSEVLNNSGHGKSINSTLIHSDNQVIPPQPDAFGQ
ncbi:unnamed protein product, partial [Clonostachys solani]